MKKPLLTLIIVLAIFSLLLSCEQAEYLYNYKMINESSVDFSYNFNGSNETLATGETTEYEKTPVDAVRNISAEGFGVKVNFSKAPLDYNNNTYTYTFFDTDVEPFALNVRNTLSIEVIIKAGEFIYDDEASPSALPELTIPAKDDSSYGIVYAFIYTKNPKFEIVSSEYPVIIDWSFEDDTVYVIIR